MAIEHCQYGRLAHIGTKCVYHSSVNHTEQVNYNEFYVKEQT